METISCHSRLGQKTWLFVLPAYRCYMWNLARIGFMASVEMSFENVDDDGRTTTDACLYYKFTYEPLTQLRWTNKKQTSQIYPAYRYRQSGFILNGSSVFSCIIYHSKCKRSSSQWSNLFNPYFAWFRVGHVRSKTAKAMIKNWIHIHILRIVPGHSKTATAVASVPHFNVTHSKRLRF